MITKEQIIHLLANDDRAVARALLVLYARQTEDEKVQEQTRYDNGRGFQASHAKRGTSMAKFFLNRGFLTPKQIAYWRATTPSGRMRISVYWRQLQEAAAEKDAKKVAQQQLSL